MDYDIPTASATDWSTRTDANHTGVLYANEINVINLFDQRNLWSTNSLSDQSMDQSTKWGQPDKIYRQNLKYGYSKTGHF